MEELGGWWMEDGGWTMVDGQYFLFLLNSLESKSLFKSMLEKYTTGGRIKGMCALFVLN